MEFAPGDFSLNFYKVLCIWQKELNAELLSDVNRIPGSDGNTSNTQIVGDACQCGIAALLAAYEEGNWNPWTRPSILAGFSTVQAEFIMLQNLFIFYELLHKINLLNAPFVWAFSLGKSQT